MEDGLNKGKGSAEPIYFSYYSAIYTIQMPKNKAMCKTDFEGVFYTDFYTV